MVTNDICLFSYGAIKLPGENLFMIFVYFHMAQLNRGREFVYFHMEQLNRGRENLVTNDICFFSYGEIKPWERIWLQMISVYFHMAKLNRGREFGYK